MGFTQPARRRWKGKWGGGEIGRSSPHSRSARIPPLPLFPFEACHTGHVIKSGEMRGYRSLPHVNIARSTGSRTRNCSNKNPAGKIKIPLSRNNSHIQSLHRRLMLACADSIEHRPSTGTCAQGWETRRILKCEIWLIAHILASAFFFFLIYFLASESLYKNYCNFLSGKQRRLGVSIMFKWPYYWDMETQKSEARGDYLITMMLVVLMLASCSDNCVLSWINSGMRMWLTSPNQDWW